MDTKTDEILTHSKTDEEGRLHQQRQNVNYKAKWQDQPLAARSWG